MKLSILALALALALALTGCATAPSRPPIQYDFTALDARLTAECDSGKFSGIAVVQVRGREVYNKTCGTGDAETQQAITRDRRFKIYSISKLLTAVAIMRLVEQEKMELDAPIARYIPEAPQAWNAVTVRHLLQHTSGLPDLTEPPLVKAYTTDHASAMRIVIADAAKANAPLSTTPGTQWRYNNFGYELLAEAGARAAGKPFDVVLREEVFERAGMRDAVVDRIAYTDGKPHSAPDPRLVKGYNGEPGKLTEVNSFSFVQLGAGAIFATVDDLLALDRAISNGRIVSKDTWKLMTESRVQTIADDTTRGWGLGMRLHNLDGIRMQTHSGGVMGYISNFVRYPDYDAVHVVLANRGFAQPAWMAEAVADVLGKGVAGPSN